MKLYRKKLDSVEALKREKIRLRYERRHTNASDLNPLAEMGKGKISGAAKDGLLGSVMELFSAKNNVQLALALAKPLFKAARKRRSYKAALREEWGPLSRKPKPSFLKKILVEIIVGYATGKAIIMTVRGVHLLMKRRKAAKLKARLAHA